MCMRCPEENLNDTSKHRYLECCYVSQAWAWRKYILCITDISLASVNDEDILKLDFPKGLRDNALIWLIGTYIDLIEKEVITKDVIVSENAAIGYFKQRKQMSHHQRIPDIGFIAGLDFDARGIG